MNTTFKDNNSPTVLHVTRHDGIKTVLYILVSLGIAITLIGATVWLFIAG